MPLICGRPMSVLDIGLGLTSRTASRWYRRSFVKGRATINQTPVADCDLLRVSLGIYQKLHYCHRPPLILLGEGSPHATVPPPPRSFRILTDLPSSPGDEWEGLLGFKVLRLTNEHDAMNWRKDLFVGFKRGSGAFEDLNGQWHD
ncbi:hypothetical protein TNCT_243201 [Trichonephila clavata]|uniref:Uncharacterized protein n=1 Tax=Trichonephila clavata TaxID=2740835 RepID=A0A8X6GA57_TRICU|nr:hypothetical protein TNCT_243201 [Trichonephila clavata]